VASAGAIWNGSWRVRRDPSPSRPGPGEPIALDVAQLPAGVRDTVVALLGAASGPGFEATVRITDERGRECAVRLTDDGDGGTVVAVSGADDPPAVETGPPGSEAAPDGMSAGTRLLELAGHGVCVVAADGHTTFANRRLAEMLGFGADELRRRPLLDLMDAADRWRVLGLFDRRRRGGAEVGDVRLRRRDGTELWADLSASPLGGEGDPGAVHGADSTVVLITDVTERHHRDLALRKAESRFRLSFEDAPVGKALVGFDGRVLEVNRAVGRILGLEPDRLIGTHVAELTHPEDLGAETELTRRAIAGEVDGFSLEKRFVRPTGAVVWANVNVSLVRDDQGQPLHLLLQVDDVTDRRAAESRSREAVARFEAAFTHAPIGMAIVELDGGLREANPGLCRMLALEPDLVRSINLAQLVHPDDVEDLERRLAELRDGHATTLRAEVRIVAPDGRSLWTLLSAAVVTGEDGRPSYLVAQAEDVTERRVAESDLVHQTLHDPLTGLGNRLLLKDRLQAALSIVAEVPFAVMFLDLDRFKSVNDTHGHDAGDALLVGVGERLRRIVRSADTVARLGGDEFAIIAQGVVDRRSAEALAEKVRAALRAPFRVGDLELVATASVGVVVGSTEYATGDQLLRDADIAMYRAKDAGRDRHELFDDEIRLSEIERLETERTLRTALAEGGLRLHYQPVIDLHTGRAIGAEALLRLEDPAQGLLSPAQFLPAAEESRLIIDVGAWVLREVCAQLARWGEAGFGHLVAWVNVSGLELASPRFNGLVQRALAQHGVAPDRLRIELTENALLEASPATISQLRTLTGLGVAVGIDDFGTGYSSLAYLRDLPVSFLKIDHSFTRRLEEPGGAALVEAIVSLGRSLDLHVIAEGVESRGQVEALAAIGCGTAQGHLFAPASSIETVALHAGHVAGPGPGPASTWP